MSRPPLASRGRFVAGAAATGTFATIAFPAHAAQFEFKCGSATTPDHPTSVRLTQMWAAIERESGGRIRTQYFPNGQLGSESSMFSQVRLGALAFLLINAGSIATVAPTFDVSFTGFAFRDAAEGLRVMDGPLGGYLRDEASSKGFYIPRTPWDAGITHVGSATHAIRTPDDLRNFKMRVVESKILVDLFRSLGASPTPISLNEVYTALQTKLVDGVAQTLASIETLRFYEVLRYVGLTNHSWACLWMVANGAMWKGLPPDLQAIVERNNTKYARLEQRDLFLLSASLEDKLTRQGVAFNPADPAPFRARLHTYYETWSKNFGPTAWGLLENTLGHKLA